MKSYFFMLLCVTVVYVSPVYAMNACSMGNNDQEVYSCAKKTGMKLRLI